MMYSSNKGFEMYQRSNTIFKSVIIIFLLQGIQIDLVGSEFRYHKHATG